MDLKDLSYEDNTEVPEFSGFVVIKEYFSMFICTLLLNSHYPIINHISEPSDISGES